MIVLLRVLCIGSPEACNLVRDALLERQRCHLTVVESPEDLWSAYYREQRFDVAVLCASLSPGGLRDAGALVRRRWPECRILPIARRAEDLDDPLYDEWTTPGLPQLAFVSLVERMTAEVDKDQARKAKPRATVERIR